MVVFDIKSDEKIDQMKANVMRISKIRTGRGIWHKTDIRFLLLGDLTSKQE
jgi:hypothetical protein